ncbi:MAG: T9SS type A sorting domain-containing protein [Cytophagales bacterium]|nr:T9SS type A sorting domain-containing protein [Cytophagales bacterium]
MKKALTFIFTTLSVFQLYAQANCERLFETTITYSNPELGLDYDNFETGTFYRVYQRDASTNTSCNILDIERPIIVVEGYDITDSEPTNVIYENYIDQHGLADQLHADGYDVIVLNLQTPAVAMQLNSLILENFIDHINKAKSTTEEIIIMGVSMGGVLARYALADMESKGLNHQTKLYISFDSPHQGAHIPLSVQGFLWNMSIGAIFSLEFANLINNYLSDGTRQLLRNHLFETENGTTRPDSYFTSFYNELENLNSCNGYPRDSKNIAIANGSLNGMPSSCSLQECPASTAMIVQFFTWVRTLNAAPGDWDLEDTGRRHFLYMANPGDIAGAYLNVGTPPYDHLPGGYFPWYDQMAESVKNAGGDVEFQFHENASFIPTISALDINTGDAEIDLASYGKSTILDHTGFDDIWWDTSHGDERHNELTVALSDWIYDQIILVEGDDSGRKSQFYNNTLNNLSVSNSEIHKAVNNITVQGNSNVSSGGNLELLASNSITLSSGFHAQLGSTFSANIVNVSEADCSISNNLNSSGRIAYTKNELYENYVSLDTVINNVQVNIILSGGNLQVEEDIKESNLNENLVVYPNPTSNQIKISSNSYIRKIELTDQQGRLLKRFTVSDQDQLINLDLSELEEGIYYLMLYGENEYFESKKIIKSN